MTAELLLRRIIDELKAGEQFVLALAIEKIGERLLIDGGEDCVPLGILDVGGTSPTVDARKRKAAA